MSLPTSDNTVNVTRLGSILSTLWAKIKTALSGKQDKLTSQTAYSAKGTATKVPQITTNSLGQVTSISEVTISGVTPASHASTATTYGIGTTSNYGHVKLATGDMNGATNADGVAVSKNHTHSQYAPKASPAFTGTPTAPTAADGSNTTQIATTAFVQSAVAQGLSVSDAMVYKGPITLGATSPGGLTVAADKGHTYKVVANGTTKEGYVDGVKVEAGDMVICNTDSTAAATSSNYSTIAAKWDFVQGNTDGVVVGPASATSGNVVVFDGATGKLVKDGGKLGTAAFKNVDTTPTDNSTNAVTSGGVKTALDGKVSSIKKNGSTITPSSGVADIGYMPVTEAQASATVQEVIQSLRVKPGGRMGSVLLYASTISSTSIPAAWYNYIWIPHRTGAAADDNQNFGTLILTPMTNTPDVYVIEGSNLNTSSAAYRIKRLGNDASFLYANLAWGGAFRTSLSPFDNYAFKSANCFFGAKPSAIRVEYSTDGGTTWLDYGLTDAYKQMLLSQYGGVSVFCGKNTHIQPGYTGSIVGTKDLSDANIADQRLRITICDSSLANEGTTGSTDRWLYCTLRRIGIYMSTQSATAGVHCLFERRTSANFKSGTDTWVSEGDYKIQGDSGWNSIPCSNATTANGITFGVSDSQTREIRFTIWSDKLAATPAASQTGNLCIYKIVAYSENLWTNNSSNPNVANYGSPYTINPETGVTQFSKGITSGVAIPISSGGTGKTSVTSGNYLVGNGTGALTEKTPNAVGNNVLTSLATGDDNLIEGDYIIASNHTSGATDTTKFVRRTTARLWNYIKSQISSVLGLTVTNYGGNAATASAAQSGSALETAINAKQNALTINDSKPITIGTAAAANTVTGQAHTHDGITSVARASVTNIDISNSGTEPARMTLSQVTNATTQGTDPGDGYVLNLLWDNAGNWDTQIYVPNSKKADKDFGHLKMRYKNESSTWGDWEYLPGAFMGTLLTSNDDLDTLYQGLPGEVLQYYWNYTNKAYSTAGKTQSGMDATTGLPTGTGTANLFVFHQSTSRTASGYVVQLMVCADIGIYYRRQFGGTWSAWTKILTATDITIGNASTAGLTKLYTTTGTNTDGTMTQNAIKTALDGKADLENISQAVLSEPSQTDGTKYLIVSQTNFVGNSTGSYGNHDLSMIIQSRHSGTGLAVIQCNVNTSAPTETSLTGTINIFTTTAANRISSPLMMYRKYDASTYTWTVTVVVRCSDYNWFRIKSILSRNGFNYSTSCEYVTDLTTLGTKIASAVTASNSDHIHDQYLPKAGGTMTGGITLPTSFCYHQDSKFGIDAKNSDIINVNSIYFNDECTDTEEGIHFKRGDSGNTNNYDSLWVDNGKICFAPNHAVSTVTASSSAQIVPRFPSSISDNQVVLTNQTTGALKTLAASSLSVGTATTANTAKAYDTSFSGTNSINTALTTHAHGLQHHDFTRTVPAYDASNPDKDTWLTNIGNSNTSFWLKSLRTSASAPPWLAPNFGAGIAFGGADTKGTISVKYDIPFIAFAGGNGTSPTWWINVKGTSGTTYTLPPMGTGDNASKYAISITGSAATATKATQDADGNNIKNSYMKATSGTKALAFGSSTEIGTVGGSAVNVSLPSLPTNSNRLQTFTGFKVSKPLTANWYDGYGASLLSFYGGSGHIYHIGFRLIGGSGATASNPLLAGTRVYITVDGLPDAYVQELEVYYKVVDANVEVMVLTPLKGSSTTQRINLMGVITRDYNLTTSNSTIITTLTPSIEGWTRKTTDIVYTRMQPRLDNNGGSGANLKYNINISGTAAAADTAAEAGYATALKVTSAIGSSIKPVYIGANGIPQVIPNDSTYSDYLTLNVINARTASEAVYATAMKVSSAIGSTTTPIYIDANGVPQALPSVGGAYFDFKSHYAVDATKAHNVDLTGSRTASTTNGDTIKVQAGTGTAAEFTIVNAKHAASADSATKVNGITLVIGPYGGDANTIYMD